MGLIVLAYPEISNEKLNTIQKFREINDRYFNLFAPHFTLVFPVYDVKEDEFVGHVRNIAEKFSPVEFSLNCAIVVKDSFSEYWDIFLLPDKGNSSIIKMHNLLYTDVLITQLRIDIPYIAHMNIGNDTDPFYCYNLARELNESDIRVDGKINALSIAHYDGKTLTKVEDIILK